MFAFAQKTISHVQGKGSLSHNNRDFHYKNVDPERTKNNITYARQTLAEAYEQCFGESVRRYNETRTRADRRIDDYYAKLFGEANQITVATAANKEKSFYETVVGIGNMHNAGVGTVDGELVAKCLDEYMRGFIGRNQNFHVFNAVLHMDEATPHLHINYIPIGHYESKGMDTRNSISQALKEMGYGTGKDAINRWRIAEREILKGICREHGIEISEEQKGRGYTLTPDEYKAQIEAEKIHLQQEARQEVETERSQLREEFAAEKPVLEGKVALAKTITRARDNMKESGLGKTKSTTFKGITAEESLAILKAASDRDDMRTREKKALAERDEAVAAKKVAEEKLVGIEEREATATEKQKQANALYYQQSELNRLYKQSVADCDFYKAQRTNDNNTISELTKALENSEGTSNRLSATIAWLKSELNIAYQDIANIVMAMSMLNNENKDGYAVLNLPLKCNNLINGISNFAATRTQQAAARVKEKYYIDVEAVLKKCAEDISKRMGVDSEIGRYVKALEPKTKHRSYDMGL